jgi:hypothetical protein
MVDTVEATGTTIPSAKELGLASSDKKSQSSVAAETTGKRKSRLDRGFSAKQLSSNINLADLERIAQEKLDKDGGAKAVEAKPDSKELAIRQAESILTEALHYKAIQAYKDKIIPEFIAVFNEAEQNLLRELVDVMDQYLILQRKYVIELLHLLGYEDVDTFFADIAAIPEVAPAISNSSNLDLAEKLAKVMGIKREYIVKFLTEKSQAGVALDAKMPNKISMPYLQLAQKAVPASGDLPVRLFALARRFDNMAEYYSKSTLRHQAKKRAAFTHDQGSGAGSHGLSTLIVKMSTNERTLMFRDMAQSISDEWLLETDEKASDCITGIRESAERTAIKLNEAVSQSFSLAVEAPDNIEENLVEELLLEAGDRLSKSVSNLRVSAESTDDISTSSKPIEEPRRKRSQSAPQLRRTASQMMSKATEITATKLESVKDAISRFAGKPMKVGAAISFSDYVGTALHSVQIFQGIAKDQTEKAETNRAKFENWQFIYKQKANPQTDEKEKSFEGKIPTQYHEGDFAEIRHNGLLVCDVVAQKMSGDADKAFNGVAVTVHRHEEEDIDLAVRVMVQSLAKVGKKKVIITVDLNSPEGGELALRYVKAILGQRAIPVLFDSGRELSAKETKAKIEELSKDNSIYQHTAEQYEATVKEIMKEQKEDAIFIKAFDKLIGMPLTATSLTMKDPNPPQDTLSIVDIAYRLFDIALLRKNLAMDDYVDKLVNCLRKDHASDYMSLTPHDMVKIKKEVKDYFVRQIAENPDILNCSLEAFKADIFDHALIRLKDSVFLKSFDNFLWDAALPSDVELKMQDPNTGETLDAHQILTRLAQIAFVRKGMEQEVFIDRALAFGLATLAPSARAAVTDKDMDDLKKELREKIRLHLDHPAAERDEGLFVAELIRFAQHELKPGHIGEEMKAHGMFGCAASVKNNAVSPQDVPVLVR